MTKRTKPTKRSKRIRLILLSGFSAGALASCAPEGKPALSTDNVYANNDYVPGAGYYHAPFCGWYPLPYNHFDTNTHRYFYGGQWGPAPWQSITNISSPTPQAAAAAEAVRTDVVRGGFGCTGGPGGGYFISS
jgi:hypothetical protein